MEKGRFRYAEGRTGHEKIVVTVIGADRVGIVAGVTKELAKENINILDISQTILDGIFDMVLICDMENAKGSLKQVQDDMGELGRELGVDVRVQLADIFMPCTGSERGSHARYRGNSCDGAHV